MDNFEYRLDNNIFKSIGLIKIEDKKKIHMSLSQVYIDTKKKEILGTDIKAFFNERSFKYSIKNKPRIFSNSLKINNSKNEFQKVYLQYAIIEKMISVRHGAYKLLKYYMIT